ncbi:MAG: patatin-like phospholipase family protein [Nitrososphaeraceae archaeon]
MNKNIAIPEKERALVLQGGGSLGAYEAGAYRALYESLSKKDTDEGRKGSSTFEIVAGTSIGAINAAVLVSYVVENHTYEGSSERLVDFWNYLSKESMVDTNPFFKPWWDYWHTINREIATGEAARRYFSAKEFAIFGIPNVFYPHRPTLDGKFYDSDNTWYRYSNEPLRRSLERFAKFPIATTKEDNQPRLLLVAVDVADGIPVTFDSYPKMDGTRKTEYGKFLSNNDSEIGFEHVVHYDEGITSDQVMASGSYPVNFDFAKIEVETYSSEPASRRQVDAKTPSPENASGYRKGMRYFWDGGLMTNTPLMQLVLLHRQYWYKVRGLKDSVPRLGICVINLHPKKQPEIPTDRDGVINRNSDITFSDRTQQEETMLLLISDFVDLIRELLEVAEEGRVDKNLLANLLNRETNFHGEFLKPRRFQDILEGRFQIDEIIRVNRKNDLDTISNKTFDFSSETIKLLLERGYNDALDGVEEYKRNQPGKTADKK